MREPRDSRSKANRAVPFQAAFLLFLAGLGTAAYFVEFRGVGFATLVAAETAPELVIVGGALLALALVTHLSVSRALHTVPAETSIRSVLRHALTLADVPADQIEDEIETLPSEIQDLVRMLSAQRDRSEGTGREIQSLRHEMNAILQGMQRSTLSLEPMRLEGASEFGRAAAIAWNQMLERVQSSSRENVPSAIEQPLMQGASQLELQSLRQRMGTLESRCGRLEAELLSVRSQEDPVSGAEPTFAGEAPDLILDAQNATLPTRKDEASAWEPPEASDSMPTPEEISSASPSGYHEWTGHASAGSWELHREAKAALETDGDSNDDESSPFVSPFSGSRSGAEDLVLEGGDSQPAAEPFVDDTYSLSPDTPTPIDPVSGEFSFPHFVGKPAGPLEGRVEVTFEGHRRTPEAEQSEELSVDPDGSASRPGSVIFDLRSLGAVELDD